MSYDVTFYYVLYVVWAKPFEVYRRVTPRLLKRLGYFQQQSQKYELTLRLEMCFMKVHNCAYSLETYFYRYMCCAILKISFLVILHINPSI